MSYNPNCWMIGDRDIHRNKRVIKMSERKIRDNRVTFSCKLYKIIDTGHSSFTLMIQANDNAHKEEIFKKLKDSGHKISNSTPDNKICYMKIVVEDFKDGKEY